MENVAWKREAKTRGNTKEDAIENRPYVEPHTNGGMSTHKEDVVKKTHTTRALTRNFFQSYNLEQKTLRFLERIIQILLVRAPTQ